MTNNYMFDSKEIFGQSLIHLINLYLPKNSVILEIGTWYAQTACMIAQNCNNVSKIYTVDPYKYYYNWLSNVEIDEKQLDIAKSMAKHNIKFSGCEEKIELIEKDSNDFVKDINDNSIDLIFLDSEVSKKSSLNDMELWYPKVKIGGVFSGHHFNQIQDVVHDFKNKVNNKNFLSVNDNVWAWIKND